MGGPFKELVKIREELKKRIPTFLRVNYYRYEKIGDAWRKQRGRHNTIRRSIKGAGKKPSIGYGVLKEARHIHPSGYKEVLVRNLKDLEKVDPNTEGIRIASTIGLKKRLEILKIAKEKGIYVFNDNIISRVRKKGYSSLKEMLSTEKVKEETHAPKKDSQDVEKKEEKTDSVELVTESNKGIKNEKKKEEPKEKKASKSKSKSTKNTKKSTKK